MVYEGICAKCSSGLLFARVVYESSVDEEGRERGRECVVDLDYIYTDTS